MRCCEEGKIPLVFRNVADSTVNHAQYGLRDALWRCSTGLFILFKWHEVLLPLHSV